MGSIESEFGSQKSAVAGDNVTIWLKGIDESFVNTGSVICAKGQRLCPVASRFQVMINLRFVGFVKSVFEKAQILISGLPDSRPIMTKGYQCVMHLHTLTTEVVLILLSRSCSHLFFLKVTIEKIVSVLDKKTGKPLKGQAFARKGAAVVVNIQCPFPIALEKYEDFNPLSRIMLRDEDLTVAVGKVMKLGVEKKK